MKSARNWIASWKQNLVARRRRPSFATFAKRCHELPPVFIYQMGKVASSSVRYSLERSYQGPVVHGHYFGPQHRKWEVGYLYRAWQEQPFPMKVVSLIREPVARNISAFFENFQRFTRYRFQDNPYSAEELQLFFLTRYPHNLPLLWLENELRRSFGLDAYQQPFPAEGYLQLRQGPIDGLLLKHDLADEGKMELLKNFVPLKELEWHNQNEGQEKPYAQLYREFKALPLPDWYLDQMYNSRYAQHFYGPEIAALREKWGGVEALE